MDYMTTTAWQSLKQHHRGKVLKKRDIREPPSIARLVKGTVGDENRRNKSERETERRERNRGRRRDVCQFSNQLWRSNFYINLGILAPEVAIMLAYTEEKRKEYDWLWHLHCQARMVTKSVLWKKVREILALVFLPRFECDFVSKTFVRDMYMSETVWHKLSKPNVQRHCAGVSRLFRCRLGVFGSLLLLGGGCLAHYHGCLWHRWQQHCQCDHIQKGNAKQLQPAPRQLGLFRLNLFVWLHPREFQKELQLGQSVAHYPLSPPAVSVSSNGHFRLHFHDSCHSMGEVKKYRSQINHLFFSLLFCWYTTLCTWSKLQMICDIFFCTPKKLQLVLVCSRYFAVHYPLDYNQAMNDTNAMRKRVIKYVCPVFVLAFAFNVVKFFEADIVYEAIMEEWDNGTLRVIG